MPPGTRRSPRTSSKGLAGLPSQVWTNPGPSEPISKPAKKNKYNAQRTVYRGRTYDSKAEARYAAKLDLLVKAGHVKRWWPQELYHFEVNGVLVGKYRADFVVEFTDGHFETHDVKGKPDRRWPLVKKLMLACHGIEVMEVTA